MHRDLSRKGKNNGGVVALVGPSRLFYHLVGFTAFVIALAALMNPAAGAEDTERLAQLEKIIAAQQTQIEAQANLLQELRDEVRAMARGAEQAATQAERATAAAEAATTAAKDIQSDWERQIRVGAKAPGAVSSGNDKVSLTLYGQVDRGVLYADDGNSRKLHSVDNDNSSTRFGLIGRVEATEDLTIGSRIEVQFESNSTGDVNQAQNTATIASNSFTERHLDLFLDSKKYGKLSVGQGNTASNDTSHADLSGTMIIGHVSVQDLAGGYSFATSGTGAIAGNPLIKNVYNDMDGLSRTDRLRYDPPKVAGVGLSTSWIDGGAWDVAARYNRKYPGITVASAAAFANQSSTSATIDSQINGSLSGKLDNGLNATIAVGRRDMSAAGRENPAFQYYKLGYIVNLTSFGPTAFAVDFGRYTDVAQNGDQADTYGLLFVQNLTNWGTELYAGFRKHKLDRTGAAFDDVDAILTGARVKF